MCQVVRLYNVVDIVMSGEVSFKKTRRINNYSPKIHFELLGKIVAGLA